jgi:hypothetical protein
MRRFTAHGWRLPWVTQLVVSEGDTTPLTVAELFVVLMRMRPAAPPPTIVLVNAT